MEINVPGYSLREADDSDSAYFSQCVAESLVESVDETEAEHAYAWLPSAVSLTEIYRNSGYMNSVLYVLEKDGERVGLLWIGTTAEQFTCEETGYVLGLYVDEAHRGLGLAKAMIMAAEEWAREKGCMHMSINCGTANVPAMNLYSSAGYGQRSVVFRRNLHPELPGGKRVRSDKE